MTPERATPADLSFMRRALALAELGWGRVHPNPLVGAVVVREGEVVGEGYHAEYGGAHAEVVALRAAGERARGATLYVTLEPCAHHGKTPPCTGAILEAGVARVVFAHEDPNPVARGGAELLREAGIEVVGGVGRELARAQNAHFFHAVARQGPFVALKYALTLDARLAESPHRPSAVTGAAARGETHRLRAGYDAIMIGIGTALADDPLLTVRGTVMPRVPPVRIIADSALRLPATSRLVETAHEAPVWVICGEDVPAARRGELERRGVRVLPVPRGARGLDLEAALERVGEEGIRSIFCEGGGQLGASFLALDRVSRLYLFYAPRLFGESAVPAFPGAFGAAAEGWRRERLDVLDEDLLLVLDRRRS